MMEIKKVINTSLILIIGIIFGFYLMVLTYLLPTDKIKENVKESINTFRKETTYYQVVDGYEPTQLDNFTDAIMLENALYDGNENAIEKAIQVYKYHNNFAGNPTNQLIKYFEKPELKWDGSPYSRYWHGYLVFLKPALLIFNYLDIRMINQIIQTLLIILIVSLSIKRNLKQYILPFIIAMLSIVPGVIALSLQFSTTVYISLISTIIILLFHEKLQSKYIYLFLIIGMITSFMDFLTCPILTVGIPLTYLIILNQKDCKQNVKDIMILAIMWAIGYVGMWIGKWIISSFFLQENLIKDALNKILERTSNSSEYESFTKLDVLECNLEMIKTVSNNLMFALYFVYIIYKAIKEKIWERKIEYAKVIPFLIIAIMPFAWYIFASNHSFVHYWFTYRSLAVTVFSFLLGITVVLFENKTKEL